MNSKMIKKELQGKSDDCTPKDSWLLSFFLTDALALYKGNFGKKGCHSKLI